MKKLTLKADKNGRIDCPFCKEKHKHGKAGGNGHRIPHCTKPFIFTPVNVDGDMHYKKDGYYVVFD